MKKIIPFTKEITFKTMISKVTSISLEHTLIPNLDNTISGDFIIDGKYKMTQASQIDEDFTYKIPVDIEIDSKYDITNVILDIESFTYEIINEEKIKVNIELCIDNLEEKEEDEDVREDNIEVLDDLFLETTPIEELKIEPIEKEEPKPEKTFDFELQPEPTELLIKNEQIEEDIEDKVNEKINEIKKDLPKGNSLFESFKDNIETFKSYSVYIVKEEDTINSILVKYGVDRESVEEYNDLSKITTGSKIIIPCSKNE